MTRFSNAEIARALKWAATAFQFSTADVFRQSPWGSVVRLEAEGGRRAFLKMARQDHEARLLPVLSKVAPDLTPHVIAADAEAGWVLLADHGGEDVKPSDLTALQHAITAYARLQAALASDETFLKQLRPIRSPNALFDELIGFLSGDADYRFPSQHVLSSQEKQQALLELSPRRGELIELAASSSALPETLNHNDLHPGNLAKLPGGRVIIYDWHDALRGPAGLSVATFTSYPPLGSPGSRRAAHHPSSPTETKHGLFWTYVSTLTNERYAGTDLLQKVLPGAILWGALVRTVDFLPFTGEADLAMRRIVRRGMLSGIREIAVVLDHGEA